MPIDNLVASASDSTLTVGEKITSFTDSVSGMSSDELISWVVTTCASFGSKILLAAVIYFVGNWIIKRIVKVIKKVFEKRNVEISLNKFIVSLVKISLTIILVLTVIGILGINTTSFLAIFASAGLAVGMALSGTLQNFAGGVLILFLKPFKVGDFIEAQGFAGTVKEISLFSTLINTGDNKLVIIPNGGLSTSSINNYSKESVRRLQWTVGVAYGSDYDRVKVVIEDLLNSHKLILQDRDKFVALTNFGASSVDIVIRAWSASEDYWTVNFDINEQIYKRFNQEGIEFPFPQMDVNLKR